MKTESTSHQADPTALTTEALKTADQNLKELLITKIDALSLLLEERIKSVNILKEEKFKELHARLAMVEQHRIEAKADDAKALDAALVATRELFSQKNECNEEAAAKSESSFTKQIEAIRKENSIERAALSERIDALKERIDRGGGKETQQRESRGQQNWLIGAVLSGLAVIIAVASIFVPISKDPEQPTRRELMEEIKTLKQAQQQGR